ncbi:dihydropteroate synthase family protein [Candidatus Peregrinibacteria bacterium]|nr:dihydropteroate synthase family protein [Candidatus Peregrinibacteria bacterium]
MKKFLQIVGILNVTPDSYYDGGQYVSIDSAVQKVGRMLDDGADWIEVGGESTGPHSSSVSVEDELDRTIPVIKAIRKNFPKANISIDSYKPEVARAAIDAGAMMINDITAGRWLPLEEHLPHRGRIKEGGSEIMFNIIKDTNAQLVLMYSKDSSPRTTIKDVQYDDVLKTVKECLKERRDAAISAGISPERIILDPGMGHFVSSDPKYSLELIARLSELQELGCPILLSPSRKSFLAGLENLNAGDRLPGTIAASAIAVLHGASYIRTHDVKEVRRGCEVASVIRENLKKTYKTHTRHPE